FLNRLAGGFVDFLEAVDQVLLIRYRLFLGSVITLAQRIAVGIVTCFSFVIAITAQHGFATDPKIRFFDWVAAGVVRRLRLPIPVFVEHWLPGGIEKAPANLEPAGVVLLGHPVPAVVG